MLGDERGFFCETYRRSTFMELGIQEEMVQDNHSRSGHGDRARDALPVDRGAAKLVRCGRGAIFDAIVDVRRGSPTFGQWEGFELTDENARMLYVPVGFAHGFCVLSDIADVFYKQDRYYADATERGIKYDDPAVGVEWPLPVAELKPSQRDADAPTLAEIEPRPALRLPRLSGDAGARHVVLELLAPRAQRRQAEGVGARAREDPVERAVDAPGRDRRLTRPRPGRRGRRAP